MVIALADNQASRTCTWVTQRNLYPAPLVRIAHCRFTAFLSSPVVSEEQLEERERWLTAMAESEKWQLNQAAVSEI
jgi:hypothetical protein